MAEPKGPFTLVTVHPSHDIANELIKRVIDDHADTYTIDILGNCTSIEDVESFVKELHPYMLVVASVWTPEQSEEIVKIAKATKPDIRTHVIPNGIYSAQGGDGVVQHARAIVPGLVE